MLKDLSHYENLGTPGIFREILQRVSDGSGHWTTSNLKDYFFNRIIDGESIFDGCLPMMREVGIILADNRGGLSVDPGFLEYLASENYMRAKVLERILVAFDDDDEFLEIFSSQYISFDIIYNLIQVDSSAFGFRYANFRKFLINFRFLSQHPDSKIKKLIVNPKYRRLFDKRLLPEVRRRKLGIENLEATLEQRSIAGMEAEEFVVLYEKNRLSGHPAQESIQRVSDYDVAAGYDVVSFEDIKSASIDRFIEVKSCTIDRRFYWSKNEVLQARIRRHQYYLYLVDPKKIGKPDYFPMIIQNPYDNVFKDESWKREEQSWLFSRD